MRSFGKVGQMKKVVLLAPTPPPVGGIAAWTMRMLAAKLPDGWQVEVVDEKIIGKREFFGSKTRLNVPSEIKRCLGIWGGLRKKLRDRDAKVVHACIPANTMPVLRELVSAVITKMKRRKFVIHFRCTVPNQVKSRSNRLAVKCLCKKADCVMVLNRQSEEFIKTLVKTPVRVIPNFVDAKEIAAEHSISEKIRRILYVGGVIETKGCLDIIETAKSFPDIEFVMVGNPDDVCAKAAEGVPNVRLTGVKSHDEIADEMAAADVFFFLTYFSAEGFSNALAEAMAAGLPCVATDWAANKDMIEDKGGVVVPIKDTDAVKKAVRYLEDPMIRRNCSSFNITKVREAYSDKVVQMQYVDCYEELTDGRRNK